MNIAAAMIHMHGVDMTNVMDDVLAFKWVQYCASELINRPNKHTTAVVGFSDDS